MRRETWRSGAIGEEERAERDKGAERRLTGYTSGRIREEDEADSMSKVHPSRNIERCPKCGRRFRNPTVSVVALAFVNGQHIEECPICYAKDFRRIHGQRWEPTGEIASFMFEEAKRTMIREQQP